MTYKDEWLLVEDVPTRILTWGTWVEDLEDNQSIVFVITGNPGVVDFYEQFLEELHTKLKMPVWAISHAGHDLPPRNKNMKAKRLFDLQDQIDHKAAIIRRYIPKGCRIYIIGHSLGAKVALELLKIPEIEQMIEKCYMLFPTVERIGDTPNAKFIKPFVRYFGTTVIFLSWIFTVLPNVMRYYMLNTTFRLAYGGSSNCVVQGGMKLIRPLVLKNVFHLVNDEFVKIRELDTKTLTRHKNKVKFYFGTTDGWSPLEYYENLVDKIPDVDAVVCKNNIKHAFSINSSTLMADMIKQWIEESQKKNEMTSSTSV